MSATFEIDLKDGVSGPAAKMLSATGALDKSLSGVQASSMSAGGGLDSMAEGLGSAIDPATLAASAVAALGAAAIATATAVVALAAGALEMAFKFTAAKNQLDATETSLAGSAAAGQATIAMMDRLGESTGMTRDQLAPLAETLQGMGIQGAALEKQLTALASVKAIGIDGGTEEYTNILKKLSGQTKVSSKDLTNLYKTGVNVDEIAQAMGVSVSALQNGLKNGTISASKFGAALQAAVTAKGAAALENQANSLSAQWEKLKENFGKLFEGVDTGPFLKGLKDLLSVFDQATPSGQAMKAGVTGALNGILAAATKVLPYVKKGIELLVIGALKMYIFFKDHWSTIKIIMIGVGVVIAAVILGIVAVLFLLALPIIAAVAVFGLLVAAIGAVVGGIVWLGTKIAEFTMGVGKQLASWATEAYDAAGNLISGLVNGIKNGAGLVWDAIKGLAKGAMDTLRSALGIASPSKMFAQLGKHVGSGFAQGIDGSTVAVGNASQSMGHVAVSAAAQGSKGGGGAANSNGGKALHVTFATGAIQVNGANAQTAAELSEHTLTLVLEKIALTQGYGT